MNLTFIYSNPIIISRLKNVTLKFQKFTKYTTKTFSNLTFNEHFLGNKDYTFSFIIVKRHGKQALWFWGNCQRRKLLPNPKTNPKSNPTPNRGAIFLGGNCLVSPNPKTNPNLDVNPNPNRVASNPNWVAIFFGGGGAIVRISTRLVSY